MIFKTSTLFLYAYKLTVNIRKKMFDEERSWVGVSLSEIYGSQSPWEAPQFPVIKPAYNHAVLFHVPEGGFNEISDRPPKPQTGVDKWNQDYVRMPCSNHSLYPVLEGNTTNLKKRWEIIQTALEKPMKNSHDLVDTILSYNTKFKSIWKFAALHKLFNEYLEEEESQYFFSVTLPAITKLALELPRLVQSPIPLLRQHKNRSVSLSQEQIASLLANAFLCTFPRRNTAKRTSEYASFPSFNFNMLYQSGHSESVLEKLKCICHYFRRVCIKVPVGVMTFTRVTVPPKDCPEWNSSNKLIGGTPLHVNSKGTIEDDGIGLLQVDFANKYLGGGVLNNGCVQEEIRFVICPELMVSMLFTEVLTPTEALLMIGCERYSRYSGYGDTFQWAGDYKDTTPYDLSGRRRCAVLAIDALPFRRVEDQYRPEAIIRELNKAWVGMAACTSKLETRLAYPGVATGNWGCGAFGGSPQLKSLLQIMACTEARRPMAYYTFGDIKLRNDIINIYNLLSKRNVTVGQLYKLIMKFIQSSVPRFRLHPFIYQFLRDEDRITTSSNTVCYDTASNTIEVPSTSNCESPDLFSADEDILMAAIEDVSKIETEISEKNNMDRMENKTDNLDCDEDLHILNSNDKMETTKQTSLLFQQMSTFDEENDHLKNALKDISDGKSITATAKKYNIPNSTRHSKCMGKTPEERKTGPKANLTTEEENRIEKWILHKAKLGFPMHPDEVRNAVQEASRRKYIS